jgi:hypothetical protein
MASFLVKSGLFAGIGAYVETKYGSTLVTSTTDGFNPLFAATPMILIGVGFFSLVHGFAVGSARKKYMDLAKQDGEKDTEERYGLPNLYAQGTSKHARAFNGVQRSHQHIMETYTSVCIAGLMGAYNFPIVTAVSTLVFAVGRVALTKGYAATEGDASKRYSSPLAFFMWYGLVLNFFLGFLSAGMTLSTVKFAAFD